MNPRVSPAQIAQRERALNLDKPVVVRYGIWASDVIQGDLGEDNRGNDVAPQLWRALKVTLRLVLVALIVAVAIAILVGSVSALRQYSAFDYSTTFAAFLFFSLPVFWLAALLKEYAAIRLNRLLPGSEQWIYTIGQATPDFRGTTWERFRDAVGHTVLPALTLILISFAQYSRYTRSSMLDVLSSDYVRTARAKGVTPRRVLYKHALRNALIPVTTIVALDFGAVIGGAIVTERVFGWTGMGTLLINGINRYDPGVVTAWLLVVAVTVVAFNLIADVIYAYLDPRIRIG